MEAAYKNGLEQLDLIPLEMRRDIHDLVLPFKFKIGLVTANFDRFLVFEITLLQISVVCPFITRITLLSLTSPELLGLGIVSLILLSMLLVLNRLKVFYMLTV